MSQYETGTPRMVSALAAMAMTAITIGLLVVLPSKMEPDSQAFAGLAMVQATSSTRCEALVSPQCVDVAAVREAAAAPLQVRDSEPKCKQEG